MSESPFVSEVKTELWSEDLLAAPAPHLKENALRLADHHRRTCDGSGATCTVSLVGLAKLLQLAGFDLTDADIQRLL